MGEFALCLNGLISTCGETGLGVTQAVVVGTNVGTGEHGVPTEGGAVYDLGDTVCVWVKGGTTLIGLVGLGRTRGGRDFWGMTKETGTLGVISDCIPFEVRNMLAVLGSDVAGGKVGFVFKVKPTELGEAIEEGIKVDVSTGQEAEVGVTPVGG